MCQGHGCLGSETHGAKGTGCVDGPVGWLNGERMRSKVEATIEVIRPALQADGGDIELVDVNEDTGVVTVRLVGACGTCPVSTDTLKGGVERIMRDRIDGVTEVIDLSQTENAI
jgi:Fe-S cluster biogenesis protein NfuA